MSTINQLIRYKFRSKNNYVWSPALKSNPQVRGRFSRMVINTPRKPNSALRKVGKIFLTNKKRIRAKIPGSGTIPQKYAVVLVKGKGHKDTPGVKYSLIRGALECLPLFQKTRRRSIYGVPSEEKTHTRRCLRS
uniref:Ribosomal protein S12 n=1 Tax=Gruberia lanceolata TaxID=1978530 RepID=A0A6C0UG12_9CILI|nr:ribosomal protein S12 [Gruberia lanceolata]